jgi:tetratricopeptide (TPR) repeat protein
MARKKPLQKVPADRREIEGKRSHPPAQFSWNAFFHRPGGVGLLCACLFGLVLWIYWPTLNNPFFFHDEFGNLVVNQHINTGLTWVNVVWASTSLFDDQWIPLTRILHMLDYQIFGTNPWGHHLTCISLHAASAVLLFLFFKKLTGALWRSLIVAGLFAFHPLRVESVAWITELKDVFSVFWGIIALWTYAEYSARSNSKGRKPGLFYGLTFLFFALSLSSKSTLVTFPCLLLLLDYWPLGRWKPGNIRRLVLEKIPFFVAVAVVSKISYRSEVAGQAVQGLSYLGWDARFENALVSYARYVGKFFFPVNLHPFYSHPEYWPDDFVALAAVLVAGLSALAWLLRREAPYLFVGWFWFFGTMVPLLGFVPFYCIAMADRYSYVPDIGLAMSLVWGAFALSGRWRNRAGIGGAGAAVLLLICIALTCHQIGFWKDEMTVLNRAAAVDKTDYNAHYLIGFDLLNTGSPDPDRAMAEFQKSVDINPHYYEGHQSLGFSFLQRGKLDEAIMNFQAALNYNPYQSDNPCYYGMGVAWFQKGKVDEGLRLCQKALAADAGNPQYLNGLSMMLLQENRLTDAAPLLKRLCAVIPNDPNAWNTLGIVLARTGQFDESISALQNALKLSPSSSALQSNLAAVVRAKQQAATMTNAPTAVVSQPSSAH